MTIILIILNSTIFDLILRVIEKQYLHLEEKFKNLKHELEIVTKSRDQKDKHLAVLYREKEKLENKIAKLENPKAEVKTGEPDADNKENEDTNRQILDYKRKVNISIESSARKSEGDTEDTKPVKSSILKGMEGLTGMDYQTEKHYKLQIKTLKKTIEKLQDQLVKKK